MIAIVAIKTEDSVVKPNIPVGVDYEVLHYDIDNNKVSVRITSNPNSLPIEEV